MVPLRMSIYVQIWLEVKMMRREVHPFVFTSSVTGVDECPGEASVRGGVRGIAVGWDSGAQCTQSGNASED